MHPHQFENHYCATIGELDQGKEYECAKALDLIPSFKRWFGLILTGVSSADKVQP
jgi:hypothetical protein